MLFFLVQESYFISYTHTVCLFLCISSGWGCIIIVVYDVNIYTNCSILLISAFCNLYLTLVHLRYLIITSNTHAKIKQCVGLKVFITIMLLRCGNWLFVHNILLLTIHFKECWTCQTVSRFATMCLASFNSEIQNFHSLQYFCRMIFGWQYFILCCHYFTSSLSFHISPRHI